MPSARSQGSTGRHRTLAGLRGSTRTTPAPHHPATPTQTAARPVRHRGPDGPGGAFLPDGTRLPSGAPSAAHSPSRLSAVVQSPAIALRAASRVTLWPHTAFFSLVSTESLLCAGSLP